jgi:hypothetical protein
MEESGRATSEETNDVQECVGADKVVGGAEYEARGNLAGELYEAACSPLQTPITSGHSLPER